MFLLVLLLEFTDNSTICSSCRNFNYNALLDEFKIKLATKSIFKLLIGVSKDATSAERTVVLWGTFVLALASLELGRVDVGSLRVGSWSSNDEVTILVDGESSWLVVVEEMGLLLLSLTIFLMMKMLELGSGIARVRCS